MNLDLSPATLGALHWRPLHGTLVQVFETGVLLEGPSGSGKSETALELLARGHRLIADDLVRIAVHPSGRLVGCAQENICEWMEIRGVGLFRVPEIYGAEAILPAAVLDLVCRLERWEDFLTRPRISERETADYLGVTLPVYRLPQPRVATPATLIELMARDQRQAASRDGAERESFLERNRNEESHS